MPPFDDINVRKAVVANFNRTDLRNTRGGELTGPVASHYLPPDFPASRMQVVSRVRISTSPRTRMEILIWPPST